SISTYSTLSTVVIDAWDFHRGVHVKADLFNSMHQLQSLTLKGVIINTDELSTDQILNVPSLKVLKLLYIDGLRGLDIQRVLDRFAALQVLKIKAFTLGLTDQPIYLSGLSHLQTAVICYYMQALPIVSSNKSSLNTLKVKRYRPENAMNIGGSELEEEETEWT